MVRAKKTGSFKPSRGWIFTINNYIDEDVYRCGGTVAPVLAGLCPAPTTAVEAISQDNGGSQAHPPTSPRAGPPTPRPGEAAGQPAAGQPAACDIEVWKAAGPSASCRYMVCGREIGKKCGTPHLQGYVYFDEEKSMKQMAKMLPRARLEQARAGLKHNLRYCGKDKKFWTIGLAGQGMRTDLLNIKEAIMNGADEGTIAEQYFGDYVRYHAGISKAIKLLEEDEPNDHLPPRYPLMTDFKNVVLMGPSQVGKTQYARAHFKNPLFIRHMDKILKFNPKKHDGIIFDDMDFKHLPRTSQIHLTDWNDPSDIHIRYTYKTIPKNTRKIFCCNEYPFTDDEHKAIQKRVTVVTMDQNGKPNL